MNEIVLKMLMSMQRVLFYMVRPILTLMYLKRPLSVPPIKNPILKLSATMLAMKIRNGELSSEEVVEACIERIKEVNPLINAVVDDRYEEALNDARLCDAKLKKGEVNISMLEKDKPLYGVPITIKESCSLKGLSLTGGVKHRRSVKAPEDGSAVTLLKNAGAIPLLVSNTPEYCTALHSNNNLFGSTMNPYDRRKTPGGSSGGEATLVTTGASPLGLGSDFVGSVRIPSLFNGIFGHKGTSGCVPIEGHFPDADCEVYRSMLVLGPLARYVDDLYLAMKVLASNSEIPLRLDESVDVKNLKVFYMDNIKNHFSINTSQCIRDAIHKATKHLSDKGAQVNKLPQDWFKNLVFMVVAVTGTAKLPNLLETENSESKNAALELLKSSISLSDHTLTTCYIQLLRSTNGFLSKERIEYYHKCKKELQQELNELLKGNAVLICPTFPIPAPFPSLMLPAMDSCFYCSLANMTELPSTHVTMGLNSDGLPVGFQVLSAQYQDNMCLGVAKELENEFGGWVPPS